MSYLLSVSVLHATLSSRIICNSFFLSTQAGLLWQKPSFIFKEGQFQWCVRYRDINRTARQWSDALVGKRV